MSQYIRLVRAGEVIEVTDRGTVVAEVRPPGHPVAREQTPRGLLELARQAQATLGLVNDAALYEMENKPVLRGVTVQELLDQERRDG